MTTFAPDTHRPDADLAAAAQHVAANEPRRALARLASITASLEAPAEAHFLAARAHALMDDNAASEASARAALAIEPGHPGAAHTLGALLSEADELPEALRWLKIAAEGAPAAAQVLRDLGVVELFLGDTESGREHLTRALEIEPTSKEVLLSLVRMTPMADGSSRARRLFDIASGLAAQAGKLTVEQRIEVYFALGKAHEDRGEADLAFAALKRANGAKRSTFRYNIDDHEKRLRRVAEIFDPALMQRLAGGGLSSERPIFIFGMPRSGTTLVEQIVSAHSKVNAAGEIPLMPRLGFYSTGQGGSLFPEWAAGMNPADCRSFAQAYLDQLPAAPEGEPRTTDKRLENYELLGLIQLALPNATFIHCRRDPRDACLSTWAMLFSSGQDWSYDLTELGRFWRAQETLMAHWRTLLGPGRMLEVGYEAVVGDFEAQARRIIAHCGLEWDEACLRFHQSRRPVRSASVTQVRQPIYNRSIGRWRQFETHLAPLFAAMGLE
jgi:tetratricopeptide (TPR) repeat protein